VTGRRCWPKGSSNSGWSSCTVGWTTPRASRVSAELMTLDAEGDTAISLRIDCGDGSLALALTLMDVIELLGVPVHALCMGQVGGPAVGVLSVCSHRSAMPSTRFSLREPTTEMQARARDVEQWAQLRADEWSRFTERLAAAAGRTAAAGRRDLCRRCLHECPRGAGLRAHRRDLPAQGRDPPDARAADRFSTSSLT
jgi:ATP-dependent protease ClpP protease subunit